MGVLAGCGDDSSDSASASSSAATSATETTTASDSGTQATTPAAAPRSGTPGSAGIPAITENATDTSKEAKIAAGTGTPSSDLLIADLVAGNGKVAASGDTVNVRYTGALYTNGEVFDASWKSGDAPVEFPLSGVVPGFAQGIEGMKVGGRREIVIPPALGYGASDSGPIPGGSTLVFVVDLVGIS